MARSSVIKPVPPPGIFGNEGSRTPNRIQTCQNVGEPSCIINGHLMRETGLYSRVCSQCDDDIEALGKGLPRLRSTVRAAGYPDGINGHVFVTKASGIDCDLTWRRTGPARQTPNE